jgi:5-hydroxyisourate hydrolase
MGKLTTHVLDTAKGKPASGMKIELFRNNESLGTFVTNADGRIDGAILEGSRFETGTYELRFHAGNYLRQSTPMLQDLLFLDVIPIRFGISDSTQHYHVPLLLSPFSYSTYRGS